MFFTIIQNSTSRKERRQGSLLMHEGRKFDRGEMTRLGFIYGSFAFPVKGYLN